jgi:hypothetical protein
VLTRQAIALRSRLGTDQGGLLPSAPGTVVLQRGGYVVAVNLGDAAEDAPVSGEIVLEARSGDGADPGAIPARGGWVARLSE